MPSGTPSYKYTGPDPVDRGDGTWQCPVAGCDRGDNGEAYTSDRALGVKQHVSRSHGDMYPSINVKKETNTHVDDIFKTVAKVTQALVADAPNEVYDRMEEIVEVRKMVARYLGKRYRS